MDAVAINSGQIVFRLGGSSRDAGSRDRVIRQSAGDDVVTALDLLRVFLLVKIDVVRGKIDNFHFVSSLCVP